MKVLHIYPGGVWDGIGAVLAALARHRASAPELEQAFALCYPGRLADELTAAGVPPMIFGPARTRFPWQLWQAHRRLAARVRAGGFDVCVFHGPWALAMFGGAARGAGVPAVLWMHNDASGRWWAERLAARRPPPLVIANSRFTAGTLGKMFRPPLPPHRIVPCPVEPPPGPGLTFAERAALRAELGAPDPATAVILQVSRMEAWKGQRVLLRALARLRESEKDPAAGPPTWVCGVVGGAQRPAEAAYLEELHAEATALGLGARVRFLGQRADVRRLLAAADVFCQPNLHPEPFGIVFVEALYAGLPVVSSGTGGALEIVDDTCGRLVPPDNADALADVLKNLLADPLQRARLGTAGPARAEMLCAPARVLAGFAEALALVRHG